MANNSTYLLEQLKAWQAEVEKFRLPAWEELPDLELYMDQVVSLVTRYLGPIPHDEKNPILTASAVNNYVRLKIMPAPVRKRYTRKHLACIIMICVLKQSLPLSNIQQIFPASGEEEAFRQIYTDFVEKITSSIGYFVAQADKIPEDVLKSQLENGTDGLMVHAAVCSVLCKFLTDKLVMLNCPKDGKSGKSGK